MEAWLDTYLMLMTIGLIIWFMGFWITNEMILYHQSIKYDSSNTKVINAKWILKQSLAVVLTFIQHIFVKIQRKESVDDEDDHSSLQAEITLDYNRRNLYCLRYLNQLLHCFHRSSPFSIHSRVIGA